MSVPRILKPSRSKCDVAISANHVILSQGWWIESTASQCIHHRDRGAVSSTLGSLGTGTAFCQRVCALKLAQRMDGESREESKRHYAISNIPRPVTSTLEGTVKSTKTHPKLDTSGIHVGTKGRLSVLSRMMWCLWPHHAGHAWSCQGGVMLRVVAGAPVFAIARYLWHHAKTLDCPSVLHWIAWPSPTFIC